MQPKKIPFLFYFFFCFIASDLIAQTTSITKKDTTTVPADSSKVYSFNENGLQDYSDGQLPFQLYNHLDQFQVYHQKNANLGNSGSAEKNLYLPFVTSDGFTRSGNSFSYFGYNDLNRRFYSCDKPYTKLLYIVGQKQEVDASIVHAHPFGKNCLVAFSFDRTRSTGFYKKQNTNNTSADLNGWYRAPGRRYSLMADMYWTTINVAENGGIKNDSSFFFQHQLDRQLVGVYLSSAKTQERFREAWIKQYWAFGNIVDTLSNDSNGIRTKIKPSWAIVNTTSLKDEVYKFSDQDTLSNYFPAQYSDTSLTDDSTYMWKTKSGLWIERFADTSRLISGKAGISAEAGELFNDTIYQHFQNVFADGSLNIDLGKKFGSDLLLPTFLGIAGWQIVSGNNAGDHDIRLTTIRPNTNWDAIWADAELSRRHPDFLYDHYSGNHYRWQNDFSATDHEMVRVNWQEFFGKEMKFHSVLSAAYHSYSNLLYFDSAYQIPQQYNGTITAYEIRLKLFGGVGPVRTLTDATFNSIASSSPIHLPKYIVRESLYGEFNLFKNALLLQTGIDATYFSSFYCDAYNANLSQFFVQNSYSTSDYVYLDVWLAMKIKPVRIFVKADNVNSFISGKRYMLVPHAPQNDFCMKFGVSWVFND